eukprot:SM000161S02437  [mRNA]  locus=s161:228822:231464:+ [translate_table: standard]
MEYRVRPALSVARDSRAAAEVRPAAAAAAAAAAHRLRLGRCLHAAAVHPSASPATASLTEATTAAPAIAEREAARTGAEKLDDFGGPTAPAASPGPLWRAVKLALGLGTVAAAGTVSYVTYSYDSDTVAKKIASWRAELPPHGSVAPAATERVLLEDFPQALYTWAKLGMSYPTALLDGGVTLGWMNVVISWQLLCGGDALSDTHSCVALAAILDCGQYYLDTRVSLEEQLRNFKAPSSDTLLPAMALNEQHVYTLVVDLNDTLIHTDWKRDRGWRTFKRPGVEAFLDNMAQYFEIVVFSDQLNTFVDPILDRVDQKGCIRYRLYRDGTQYTNGQFLRDLSKLNRDENKVMYITGHPETCMQQENVLTIEPWKLGATDTKLLDLLPFLECVARQRPADTRAVLASYKGQDIPTAFKERTLQYQRKVNERKSQSMFWRS